MYILSLTQHTSSLAQGKHLTIVFDCYIVITYYALFLCFTEEVRHFKVTGSKHYYCYYNIKVNNYFVDYITIPPAILTRSKGLSLPKRKCHNRLKIWESWRMVIADLPMIQWGDVLFRDALGVIHITLKQLCLFYIELVHWLH